MSDYFYRCDKHDIAYPRGAGCPKCKASGADRQIRFVERLTRESLGYMNQVFRLRGKIQSALAIIDGPAFGEHDSNLGDAVMVLRAALQEGGEDG